MALKDLIKSVLKGEILLPLLRRHLEKEKDEIEKGIITDADVVIADADMTIRCFEERKKEYETRNNFNYGHTPMYHPSALGVCARKMWYGAVRAPRDRVNDGGEILRSELIFETGTYVHVMFQNLCEKAGVLVRREIQIVRPDLQIIGHADGELEINKERYLLEIKTINARQFALLNEPHHAHKRQMTAYMKALGIKKAIIVYYNKDRHDLIEFVFEYSEDFYKKEVETVVKAHFHAVGHLIMPPREGTNPRRMPCMFCEFTSVCYDTFEAEDFAAEIERRKQNRIDRPKRIKLRIVKSDEDKS
jgi:hypothetical protein